MEELRKLERVQKVLSFMEIQGLSCKNRDSDRFFANFLLFMISASTLEMALHLVIEDSQGTFPEYSSQFDPENTSYGSIQNFQSEDEAVIKHYAMQKSNSSFEDFVNLQSDNGAIIKLGSMQRANSTLEDFCRSYFMFHGMNANQVQSIFMYLPILYFTESYIYQLDTLNEKQLLRSTVDSLETHHVSSTSFDPLINLLQQQGLMTERIRNELKHGIEYWNLERKLCDELTTKEKLHTEDVMRAIHLKSFDYRVLNLLVYQLRCEPVNELHMEFLSVSEFLVEVSDDLYDYEEDVIDNTFNILRMFAGIFGASKAPTMLVKCISDAEERYKSLCGALDPELSVSCWRRHEEATREGCMKEGKVVGKWTIPPIIVNEEMFRLQASANKEEN
ncbi:hypothetical protein HPP92_010927 [Vanilla planifolia]|uniref:Uncharacterized protein n=1 Tax=Vanilla planifolia TaxID=51239 RepID=A0A835V304_VANPL|nr:hypothetical protein HPP92_010927 [Vanilla planifolia]